MVKRRYPARAILAVAGAGLLFGFNIITGFLLIALMLPLIPVFITIMMGNACLLTAALEYATRVSAPMPTGMLQASQHAEKVPTSPSDRATC